MNIFAARLVNLRKGKGLTQDGLADALHVSHSAISMVEAGAREPSKELAKRLADFFQVPVTLFIDKADPQSPVETQRMISTAELLLIADIVADYLRQNNFELTQAQRVALVEHFYQQNITDEKQIRDSLSVLRAMLSSSLPGKDK